jgi:hypothetical protein
MRKKLFAATGSSPVMLRALALVALLLALSGFAASAASAARRYGEWKVRPAKTLQLTNMYISACDTDTAYIYVDGVQYDELGTNNGNQCNLTFLPDYSFTPTDGSAHTVTLELFDESQGCGFFSDGPNAIASHTVFSINDGGGSCSILPVSLDSANLHGNVSVFRSG